MSLNATGDRLTSLALADAATGAAEPALDLAASDPGLLMLIAECQMLLRSEPLPTREILACIKTLLSQPRGGGGGGATEAPQPASVAAAPALGRAAVPMNAARERAIADLQEKNARSGRGLSFGSTLEFNNNVAREKAGFEVRPALSLVEYAGVSHKLKEARGGDCFNAPDHAHDFRFDSNTRKTGVPNISRR